MSSTCCTCYKLKGESAGIHRLATIVRRILRWRGSYWGDYLKHWPSWRPFDIYGINCLNSKIQTICWSVLEDVRDDDIEDLPDGKSIWTFWTGTSRCPWEEMWEELAARYVPEAQIYYFAENIYDGFSFTNDVLKQYFPQDYVLCIDAGSSAKAEPGWAAKLCSYLDRPEYRRDRPEEKWLCVSYWSVYGLQQMFRDILGLPQGAIVEAKKYLEEFFVQSAIREKLYFRYLPVERVQLMPDPCDSCSDFLMIDRENDFLEEKCEGLKRCIGELRKALYNLQ
ncbi:MAG: hypothetical protein PUG02_01275 [Selenomonadaceae bacterium]|nr:hypothetical protein [Selenomonadaceae bacterium]